MDRKKHHGFFWRHLCLLVVLLFITSISLSAQYLRKDWDYDYGGIKWEECNSVIETSTGNYIMAGYTASDMSGDITSTTYDQFPSPDKGDFWVLVTDANGIRIDNRRYGGDRLDRLWSIEETMDGGFIMGGWSRSNVGNNKSEPCFGELDYWILKVDQNLNYQWDKTYGGDQRDFLFELIQTSDGGYLAVGTSESGVSGSKHEPHRGDFDLWIVKTDSIGTLKWEKTIGGVEEERVNVVFEEADGNYVIGGSTESPVDGADILETGYGGKDYWVIKLDSLDGNKYWEKRWGGSEEDEIQAMIPVSTGGYLMTGGSRSPAEPGIKAENSQSVDIWAVKYNETTDSIEWERTLGGTEFDNCYSVKENTVGNFILGGYSQSELSATKTSPNRGVLGTSDFWINYLSPTGVQVWDQAFGGPESDVLEDVFQTSDGGYILAGHSISDIGGDKTDGTNGLNDFWIVKTLCDVEVEFNDTIVCPNVNFVLDARDSTCVLCDWQWENNNKDSIRTLSLSAGQTFSVTLTDGVGCRWSDDVIVDVHAVSQIDIGPDQEICEGDSIQIGIAPEVGDIYRWQSGEASSFINVDSTGIFLLSREDQNQCIQSDNMELVVNPNPVVNLGPDTSICSGQEITLFAGSGHSQIDWSVPGSGSSITFSPMAPVTVDVMVTNNFNCTATDQFQVNEVYNLPEVNNLVATCSADNNSYTVSFEVNNFASTELVVAGLLGSWNGNVFTSDTLDNSEPYDFSVLNLNNCDSGDFIGTSPCICLSDAGSFDQSSFDICQGNSRIFSISGVVLDINDNIEYLLHDGDVNTLGNILFTYPTNEVYNPGFIPTGTTLYLTIQVGNADGTSINANDACLSLSPGIPVTFYDAPTPVINMIGGQSLNCDMTSLSLNGSSSFGNGPLDYEWTTQTGNIITNTDLTEVEINLEGWYFLNLEDNFGCANRDSVFVEAEEGLPFIALSDPGILSCTDSMVVVSAFGSSTGTEFQWTWTGNGINNQTSQQVEITSPGTYSLIIENTDTGCDNDMLFEVIRNVTLPEISAGSDASTSCISEEATLQGSIIAQCDDCSLNWETINGTILTDNTNEMVEVDGLGMYYLTATNNSNGCVETDSVEVIENTEMPDRAMISSNGPPCVWDHYGYLNVDEIIGGTFPYEFSLNGITFQESNEFENLAPGNYTLAVIDALGCTLEQEFNIPNASSVSVLLPDDFVIELGDSIQLIPTLSNNVTSVEWTGYGTENCPSCPIQSVTPLERTEYFITVANEAGCKVEARVLVDVKDEITPFIPNAFSPNNDGINDRFFPFFSDKYIQEIQSFTVVNRWGGVIWRELDLQPFEFIGWDGTYKGKKLSSDVFVYSIDVILINGDKRNFSGDVTLFR